MEIKQVSLFLMITFILTSCASVPLEDISKQYSFNTPKEVSLNSLTCYVEEFIHRKSSSPDGITEVIISAVNNTRVDATIENIFAKADTGEWLHQLSVEELGLYPEEYSGSEGGKKATMGVFVMAIATLLRMALSPETSLAGSYDFELLQSLIYPGTMFLDGTLSLFSDSSKKRKRGKITELRSQIQREGLSRPRIISPGGRIRIHGYFSANPRQIRGIALMVDLGEGTRRIEIPIETFREAN